MSALRQSTANIANPGRVEWPGLDLPGATAKFGAQGMADAERKAIHGWYEQMQVALNQRNEALTARISELESRVKTLETKK